MKPRPDSALLVIDVQNDFCHPDGVYGRLGADLSAVTAMLPRLRETISAWRAEGGTVMYVRTEHSEATDSAAWLERGGGNLPKACRAGSWGAELMGVQPEADDVQVVKSRYSGFYGTSLEAELRSRGIREVLVTGVLGNVCVETTIREGCLRDFRMVMLRDCCASYDQSLHEAAMENVRRYFGTVIDAGGAARRSGPGTADRVSAGGA